MPIKRGTEIGETYIDTEMGTETQLVDLEIGSASERTPATERWHWSEAHAEREAQ